MEELTLSYAQLWPLILFGLAFATKGFTRGAIQCTALIALAVTVDGLPVIARTVFIVLGVMFLLAGIERNGKN